MSSRAPNVDIRALASLARVEISDEEVVKLDSEIPNIIAFVEMIQAASVRDSSELKKANVSQSSNDTSLRNVVRADADPHEAGAYTEALLSAAPIRDGDRIAVKQVVSRNNQGHATGN